jgi:predicted phosphodiesterase
MRYLVISDLHSNSEALTAVIRRVRRKKFDKVVVLGDFVGYAANPNKVLDLLSELRQPKIYIRGNHDKVVAGVDTGENFNSVALAAARWTTAKLTPANLRFVRSLPKGPREVDGEFLICHGSPLDEDAYVFSDYDAYLIFRESPGDLIFFGHSHIPSLFTLESNGIRVEAIRGNTAKIVLDRSRRYLVNPGSIGQPRDRNTDSPFMIFDSESRTIHFERVPYDIGKAREKILRAGLPPMLGDRLLSGT